MAKVSEPFFSQDLISNSPYCLPYKSYDVGSENLVFSIQSLMGVNGLSYQQLIEKNRAILTDIAEEKRALRQIFRVLLWQ